MTVDASQRRERIREGVTMALYISLSLLAVMVALPTAIEGSDSQSQAWLIFLAAIGLLIAHQLAFRISARLAHSGQLASEHMELLGAQLVGGLAVTAVAVVPVLLIEGPAGLVVSELLLVGFIATVGYAAARTVPVSRARAAAYTVAVVALSLVVIWIKNLAPH